MWTITIKTQKNEYTREYDVGLYQLGESIMDLQRYVQEEEGLDYGGIVTIHIV